VRVIANIWGDEDEIWKGAVRQIRIQHFKWYHRPITAFLIEADIIEVNERIVLLEISQGILLVTGCWHVFLVGLPGQPGGFDQVRQAGCINKTIHTGVVDPEGIPADHGNIIGQARMTEGKLLRQTIEIWHLTAADNGAELLILKNDYSDVGKTGNRGFLSRGWYGCNC
jgi:hypothetical protein